MKRKYGLGLGFSEEVIKVKAKSKPQKVLADEDWKDALLPNFNPLSLEENQKSPWRIAALLVLSIVTFFIIFLRIFHLQIVEGEESRELADGNRIQIKLIHAPRGVIYDRNGKILATSQPAFRLYDHDLKKTRFISREEALELEVKNDPRVQDLEVDSVRTYPLGEALAHVVGYVGETTAQDLEKEQLKSVYKLGDRIGQIGIEARYESVLKGRDGGEVIEVDSKGAILRTLRRFAPTSGQNIYLTIDFDLQKVLYRLMRDTLLKAGVCCGAAIAMDPMTGQILALVSFPTFDPNMFTKTPDDNEIAKILSSNDSPILNRAIGGIYPPGSTFKIVSSLAGLASGKVSPQTLYEDTGEIFLGPFRFTNWYFTKYGRKEGQINLIKALQRSNDIYFYRAGELIGETELADWARKVGIGKTLGIDLPGEEKGLVPDNEWKLTTHGDVWYPGDTLHMAIGQGFLLTTPLQVLSFTSLVAGDGVLFKPQLGFRITDGDGNEIRSFKSEVLVNDMSAKENMDAIKKGLELVTQNGGTAWPFFNFPIKTAGKTGTAEYGDPKDKTHAWYTSYAPADDPKVALTVLIEGGGEGSSVAAPVAKELYRWYFSEDKNKLIKDIYIPATESARTLGE